MEITVSSRHGDVTQDMKGYAHEKARKLEKYFDRIGLVEVILNRVGDRWEAEMVVSAKRGKRLVANTEHGSEMFSAIDTLADKMERQLIKWKEKMKSHRLKPVKEISAEALSYDEDSGREAGEYDDYEITDRPEVY